MTMIPLEVSVLVAAGAVALFVVLNSVDSCYIFPADVPNPCRGVVCRPGAECRPTRDGRSYECHCPESCPSYGDHTGSRPFCGSDAKDYPGECEMQRAACHSGDNITLKYYGKCDPCAGISCPDPEVCQLDAQRNPACRCAEPCSLEFSPVCASDGKTYSNECQMNRESCRARKHLKVVFKGQCSSGVNPCAEVQCRHGGECRVEVAGAKCTCATSCEPVLRPVCGSDGRTHDSECELRRLACTLDKDLKVAHFGVCGSQGACVGRVCPHGGECVAAGGRGVCRCPRCSNEFAPVCGSDGISYGNRCKLQLEACRHKRDVHVIYDGPCNGCENKKCDYYAVCESDGVADAGCVCPKHCEEGTETEEVCGSDNRTYVSLCELRNTACKEKRHIVIKHMGSCESCLGIQCQAGTWCSRGQCSCSVSCAGVKKEPVCSTTGRTYPHECALKKAACETKMRGENNPMTVAFYGECSDRRPDVFVQANNKSDRVILKNDIQPAPQEDSDSVVYHTVDNEADICSRVQCAYEATCATDSNGQPKCACQFDCAAATASATGPVCASDLRLYPTLCHMKLEACRRQEDLRLRPLPLCKGLEFKPCGDDEPILDASGRPMDCGGGPHRKDCPAGSYCHHTLKASRCCKKVPEAIDKGNDKKKGCEDSWQGCCPDGVTPARGAGGVGCPTQCGCHRLGSSNDGCDENGQCSCRPGVGGLKCDRCEPGYWGLPRIGMGHTGCIPCGCSAFGSVREDCEQMTGRCVCKPGIQGQKCTVCGNHEHALGPNGCYDPETTQLPATSCDHASCHFGAGCMIRSGLATCTCPPTDCPAENSAPSVCGSDGKTYLSACHLKSHACQTQTDVVVQAFGHCSEEVPTVSRDKYNPIPTSCPNNRPTYLASSKDREMHVEDGRDNNSHQHASNTNEIYDNAVFYKSIEIDANAYHFKVPMFGSSSRMKVYTKLPHNSLYIFADLSFKCSDGEFLSVYGLKDHVWMGIVNSSVVLSWDAGSGSKIINTGRYDLKNGLRRIRISVRRYKRDAILKVNGSVTRGTSPGQMKSLDLHPMLYIGQSPSNISKLYFRGFKHLRAKLYTYFRSLKHLRAKGSFTGCIHRLLIGSKSIIPPSPDLDAVVSHIKECSATNLADISCLSQNV